VFNLDTAMHKNDLNSWCTRPTSTSNTPPCTRTISTSTSLLHEGGIVIERAKADDQRKPEFTTVNLHSSFIAYMEQG
jgi:hypothetical protein